MKRILTLVSALFISLNICSQSPEKMNYQAVIRYSSNMLVKNQNVSMQISIIQGNAFGASMYIEKHSPTTNINGLVSLEIGTGTVVHGDFSTIDWSDGPYFIKTETDPTGGLNYTISGTSQLMSVPYALHAKTAEYVLNGSGTNGDADSTNEIQHLSLNGTLINISKGNSLDISQAFPWKKNGTKLYYNNGNVGIGTNNPSEKLTLEGSTVGGSGRTFLKLINNSTDAHSSVNFKLHAGNSASFTGLYHHSSTYTMSSGLNDVGVLWNHGNGLKLRSTDKGVIIFETGSSTSNITEYMRINQNGNIGIGTSSPSTKLEVIKDDSDANGNVADAVISIKNNNYSRYRTSAFSNAPHRGNQIQGIRGRGTINNPQPVLPGDRVFGTYSHIHTSGGPFMTTPITSIEHFVGSSVESGVITFSTLSPNQSNREERIRIDEYGNIGVGTNNPKSKLQVTDGDVYIDDASKGVIMKSPNGQCWRMTVSNTGSPVFTSITCP